jgi:uncharacterized protein (DUF1800 family)
MVRDILTPTNLQQAPAKYRQPYQLVLATLRATQPTVTNASAISGNQLRILGQPLFQWEDPDGFPDNVDWWSGLILQRWNYASFLSTQTNANVNVDVAPLMVVNTPAAITDEISKRAFGGLMSESLKQHLITYLSAGTINATRVRESFALALSSSEFQWY